jgi:hypothetical protein
MRFQLALFWFPGRRCSRQPPQMTIESSLLLVEWIRCPLKALPFRTIAQSLAPCRCQHAGFRARHSTIVVLPDVSHPEFATGWLPGNLRLRIDVESGHHDFWLVGLTLTGDVRARYGEDTCCRITSSASGCFSSSRA